MVGRLLREGPIAIAIASSEIEIKVAFKWKMAVVWIEPFLFERTNLEEVKNRILKSSLT